MIGAEANYLLFSTNYYEKKQDRICLSSAEQIVRIIWKHHDYLWVSICRHD